MIGAVVFFVGLGLVAAYILRLWGKTSMPHIIVSALIGLAVVTVLANFAGALLIVPAGNRVVVFDKFSGVRPTALGEGMHVIVPFVQEAIQFDVRVQKVDVKASAASKDLQDVSTEVVLNYRPNPDLMPKIYQQYGQDYADKVVTPAVQEAVKAVVATYTAEEIITKREKVKDEVQLHLSDMIAKADLQLVGTYMTNFSFSEAFAHAIEQKQVAEQLALKAQRDLDRVKIEADQRIAQARAEAEGLKMQKEAITPQLIELRRVDASLKAIDKWNGVLPVTMLGDKSVPFLNLSSKE